MKFGDYRIEILPDSEFRLDGGALFGVVPRVLWEKRCPPDELNRIRLNMNCLFVETPRREVMVRTRTPCELAEIGYERMFNLFEGPLRDECPKILFAIGSQLTNRLLHTSRKVSRRPGI